jgi:1-deoxy-D-xylulose-5-phosphate synthase
LLVILNDNDMSISEPVGAFNNYLARMLSGQVYNYVRRGGKQMLSGCRRSREMAKRWESHTKGLVLPGTIFEEFGFNYIGPIDGHDLDTLISTLNNVKALKGPQFLHVMTKKGFGYARPRRIPSSITASPDSIRQPASRANPPEAFLYADFWRLGLRHGRARSTPHVHHAGDARGFGLVRFSREYPNRYFDVGIAEQHALTFSAGLACEGMKPVVAIYSTFLQRAYDQLIHDITIQNLPVLFAIDRAGVVGADGATHIGAFDLSYLRCLPNMAIMAPADENECRQMLYTGFKQDGPVAVRYPRGSGPGVPVTAAMTALPFGKADVRRRSGRLHNRLAILSFGNILQQALLAGESLDATVVNMRFVKPLDVELILRLAAEHAAFVTVEENVVAGGAGTAVAEVLASAGITLPILHLGLPDSFPDHGDPAQILRDCGLDAAGIGAAIEQRFSDKRVVSFPKPAA